MKRPVSPEDLSPLQAYVGGMIDLYEETQNKALAMGEFADLIAIIGGVIIALNFLWSLENALPSLSV